MPELGEQPAAENPEQAPQKPARKRAAPGEAVLSKLKKKYRLDDEVRIDALGHDGRPLGKGPLLDPQVFNKFAELDNTKDKRYLDWMLYQAGGGPEAVTNTRASWGEDIEPLNPMELISEWQNSARSDQRMSREDVDYVSKKPEPFPNMLRSLTPILEAANQRGADDPTRYEAIVKVLQATQAVPPGREEKAARDLMNRRIKKWVQGQSRVKARDRVHMLMVYNKLLKRQPIEEIEKEWNEKFHMKRKHEYVLGDEDALRWSFFGFARHWPGKDSRYEKVYNIMKQFLINKERVAERMSKLDQWNAAIKAKNAELNLGADQAIPLREPLDLPLDIGKVTLTKDLHLVYQGDFPKLSDLDSANDQIEELPMRERITGDIRYAGPKGKIGRSEKLYSDANLDVLVPLTVMASIKGGHPSWDISDPKQLKDLKNTNRFSGSAWQRTHEAGNSERSAVTLFFVLKQPDVPPKYQRMRLTISMGDLVELDPEKPGAFSVSTKWGVSEKDSDDIEFRTVIQDLKSTMSPETYSATARSIVKGLRVVSDWSKEFDPRALIPDYLTYHRNKAEGRRGLREMIQFRAQQVVSRLIEA